jgi:hypothetical protein
LKYLKGTADFGLMYGLASSVGMPVGKPIGHTDADFALQEHQHSMSGYAFLIHGGAVLWLSKTQAVIALSSTEAEYIASTHAAKEAKWLVMLLSEIGAEAPRPFPILADNMSAIALSKDNVEDEDIPTIVIVHSQPSGASRRAQAPALNVPLPIHLYAMNCSV